MRPGTTFALVGHNGSGKCTMLKCLAKILRPDEGSVAVEGKVSALLELGAGFHPELSGRENVYLNGAILGLTKREIDRKFDDIVGFAGLERFIDSPVKNYSSGMYVRLGFSVAINVDPDVLLIDEVLAVGDEEFQRKCLERVDDLRSAGKTIVVVTHSLDDRAQPVRRGHLARAGRRARGRQGRRGRRRLPRHGPRRPAGRARTPTPTRAWASCASPRSSCSTRAGGPWRRRRTGDAVTFRLHYEATEPVTSPGVQLRASTPPRACT